VFDENVVVWTQTSVTMRSINSIQHIQSLYNLSKYGVFVIQIIQWTVSQCHIELRAIPTSSRTYHPNHSLSSMSQLFAKFISKVFGCVTIEDGFNTHATSARARWVSTLGKKPPLHPMEETPMVIF
jgi:hypothetical protein